MTKHMINNIYKWGKNPRKKYMETDLKSGTSPKRRISGILKTFWMAWLKMNWGSHLKLADDFPVLIIEEELTGTVDAMGIKTINRNSIDVAATADSRILHTPGVCGDNGAPKYILNNHTPKNLTTAGKYSDYK